MQKILFTDHCIDKDLGSVPAGQTIFVFPCEKMGIISHSSLSEKFKKQINKKTYQTISKLSTCICEINVRQKILLGTAIPEKLVLFLTNAC